MEKINDYSEMILKIQKELKDYILEANLKSLVLGISGGIDSAIVAAIAKPVVDELGIPLIGRSISIESNKPDEEERARLVGKQFCSDFEEVDLTEQYLVLKSFDEMEGKAVNDNPFKIRMGNIKARMRMIYLYNIASRFNGLVLSTDNLTELNLGFWTICGDVGDYAMIQELWKTEVYDMSEFLVNVFKEQGDEDSATALNNCILCNATDGLGISNTDLDQILPDWKERHENTRSGYEEVDDIFISFFELTKKLKSEDFVKLGRIIKEIEILRNSPVIKRYFRTAFKREHPKVIKREDIF